MHCYIIILNYKTKIKVWILISSLSFFTITPVRYFFLWEISFLFFQFLFTLLSGKSKTLQPLWEHISSISRAVRRKEQKRPVTGWPGTQSIVLSAKAPTGGFTNWPSCAEQPPPKPAWRKQHLKGRETTNYPCLCLKNNFTFIRNSKQYIHFESKRNYYYKFWQN